MNTPTPNNHVQLVQVLNHSEYAFGPRPFAHHGPRGCNYPRRITKWQIILDGDFFGNYPTKKDALAEIAKYGLQIISITKYNPNPFD